MFVCRFHVQGLEWDCNQIKVRCNNSVIEETVLKINECHFFPSLHILIRGTDMKTENGDSGFELGSNDKEQNTLRT